MESFLFAINLAIVLGLCKLSFDKDNEDQAKNETKERDNA
jgi:hypothetical protein